MILVHSRGKLQWNRNALVTSLVKNCLVTSPLLTVPDPFMSLLFKYIHHRVQLHAARVINNCYSRDILNSFIKALLDICFSDPFIFLVSAAAHEILHVQLQNHIWTWGASHSLLIFLKFINSFFLSFAINNF